MTISISLNLIIRRTYASPHSSSHLHVSDLVSDHSLYPADTIALLYLEPPVADGHLTETLFSLAHVALHSEDADITNVLYSSNRHTSL